MDYEAPDGGYESWARWNEEGPAAPEDCCYCNGGFPWEVCRECLESIDPSSSCEDFEPPR